VFVFDVISLPFSFPVGDVSDDDDAVTDVILFSCIFPPPFWVFFFGILLTTLHSDEDCFRSELSDGTGRDITIKIYEKFAYK
jgi:hypothetical protein